MDFFHESQHSQGNDEDMALRSILSWGADDDDDDCDDDNDRQSSAASMASSNEALGPGGSGGASGSGPHRGESSGSSSFLEQLKAEYGGGGVGGNSNSFGSVGGGTTGGGSLQLPFPMPPMTMHPQTSMQSQQQQQVQHQQAQQQQQVVQQHAVPQHHQHQHPQPQVIAPAPTPGASPAPPQHQQPVAVAPQSAPVGVVGYAPIQPQGGQPQQQQQLYQPQQQQQQHQHPGTVAGQQQPQQATAHAPPTIALPPGMPQFLGAIPLQQQFNMAAADPAAFLRQMQAMQQQQAAAAQQVQQQQAAQQHQQVGQQPGGMLQQQTMQPQQQQAQPQGPPPQQQQAVMAAMPPQAQQQQRRPSLQIAPQAPPPPMQTPQHHPAMAVPPVVPPPPAAVAAPPPTTTTKTTGNTTRTTRTKQSRRKKSQPPPSQSQPPMPPMQSQSHLMQPHQMRAPIVSCSDTDGLTTDAESGRMQRGSSKAATCLAPSPAALRRGSLKNQDGDDIGGGSNHEDDGLTKEERAKVNRDRNREHARNTRLRKKAYLEKLKVTVEELCRERDTLVTERAGAANLLVEMHNTRTDVLLSFFALRSAYERRRELWASILDESCFTCVMPVTPYRSFPSSEVQVARCQRTILGIDGMMSDTASLHVLLNSIVDRSRFPNATIQFRYTLVTEDAVVAGNQMMARWVLTTLNAIECGARMEVSKRGMLCCKFNSAHKITGLELMFDVMAFMLQLKQSVGTDSFAVVPNTVQTCQRPFDTPMVMTLSERPYTIVQVNKLWEEMTGWKAEDVVGKASCRILQGQQTERANLETLMASVRYKRPVFTVVSNYTKTGRKFKNFLNVYPLSTDSKITHYVGLTTYTGWADGGKGGNTAPLSSAVQVVGKNGAPRQVMKTPAGMQQGKNPAAAVGTGIVSSSSNATVASHSSINTHQAVAPRMPQPPTQPMLPQGRQPQVVVPVPGRQDSCNTDSNGDTVSSLTSSVSSSSSRGSGGSGSNASATPLQSPQSGNLPVGATSSLPGTVPMDVSRTTAVTTGSSSSSSAGGSTSTNSSSSAGQQQKVSSKQKRGNRKRKSKAGDLSSREKKQKMEASN